MSSKGNSRGAVKGTDLPHAQTVADKSLFDRVALQPDLVPRAPAEVPDDSLPPEFTRPLADDVPPQAQGMPADSQAKPAADSRRPEPGAPSEPSWQAEPEPAELNIPMQEYEAAGHPAGRTEQGSQTQDSNTAQAETEPAEHPASFKDKAGALCKSSLDKASHFARKVLHRDTEQGQEQVADAEKAGSAGVASARAPSGSQAAEPNYDEMIEQREQQKDELHIERLNDKETVPWKLSCLLLLRQVAASCCAHTTLPVFAPRLAMKLGPSVPATTALPYLLTGALAGMFSALICNMTGTQSLSGGFCIVFYVLLTGLNSFRGLAESMSIVLKRRADTALSAACIVFPVTVFIFTINLLFATNEPYEGAIILALMSMLSGSVSATLAFDLQQDPVDSCGTMTLRGLIVSILLSVIPALLLLQFDVALSVLGLALLMRIIIGHLYRVKHAMASRLNICAAQFVLLLFLLFDVLLFGLHDVLLSDWVYICLGTANII